MTAPRLIPKIARTLLLGLTLCASFLAGAQVAVPALTGHIIDQTGTLTTEQKAALEQTLAAFEASKGSQLAVLIVPTSAPEAIALTDATSNRIINETIVPRFKQQDFYGGITAGVAQIIRVIDGEPLPAPSRNTAGSGGDIQRYVPLVFILALAVGGVLRSLLGKVPGSLVTGGVVAVIAWFVVGAVSMAAIAGVFALFITLVGGGMGGHGLGGFYGGGRGGHGGGGGFRGGGGGFGGGGASGRW
ncbi:MAG: hypothetical protein B7Y03_11895 [Polaromonas sp. 24-62-144]|nr:MAG: hypothetical protein B7Y03_11895 [Polaromonas sp. 24-62-144]